MAGFEITNRNEVRSAIAAGGWIIVWGDLLNEFDVLTLAVHLATATPGVWVEEQVAAQLVKFSQSLNDVSDDVLNHAKVVLEDILKHQLKGEWEIDGLGIKSGIATYNRWWQIKVKGFGQTVKVGGKNKLPNNYQPYIGLRVAKPLPPKGATAQLVTGGGSPAPTPSPSREPSPSRPISHGGHGGLGGLPTHVS